VTKPAAGPQTDAMTVYYAEDHAALRWPLLAAGLAAPVIALACAVAAIVLQNVALLVVCLLALAVWTVRGQLLPYVWPAGIRLDEQGVRIGAVRWADQHRGRARPRPTVARQWSQEFRCPWPAIQRIGVVTDRQALKTMIRYSPRGRRPTPLGNLATPFMRAALVIWVDNDQAVTPEFQPARGLLAAHRSRPGFSQPLWVAPTCRPRQLQAALKDVPLPAKTIADPQRDPFAETRLDPEAVGWESQPERAHDDRPA
jgi:hypothetical protein